MFDDAIGVAVGSEADEHLVEHDVVGNRDSVDLVELLGEAVGQRAAAVDELSQPAPAELASAAQVANPRARRDASGTKSLGERRPP